MFTWISAGCGFSTFAGVSIYVRERRRGGEYEETVYPEGLHIKLKDRELFVTKAGLRDYDFYHPLEKYDYALFADLMGFSSAVKHKGLMFCYDPRLSKRQVAYDKKIADVPIYGDSGGFQLLSGVSDFIDPVDLAKWFNRYVTKAMCLDLPIATAYTDKKLIARLAKLQRRNTEEILSHLDPNIELYNIVHGVTNPDHAKQYIDIVDRPELKNWAIGGSYFGNLFDLVYNMFSVISYKPAPSYHMFGVADSKALPIFAWVGKYYNITSDSSTPLQSGTKTDLFTISGYKLMRISAGRKANQYIRSSSLFPFLSCSCPVCSVLGTTEPYFH
jgi:hypothetical protein